jgi:hypothetical protein
MITLDKHLALLVKADKVDLKEAQKWVNNLSCFVDAMKHD